MTGIVGIAAGIALLVFAIVVMLSSARLKRNTGLPTGQLLQSDTGAPGEKRGRPLYSARYGLTGTPDYLVQTPEGTVPVEVKPSRREVRPLDSHVLQVLAYCLLVEEAEGKSPPHGLLRYNQSTFKIDYNAETRAHLLAVLAEMRSEATRPDVARNHNSPARCRACAYRPICDQSLWQSKS